MTTAAPPETVTRTFDFTQLPDSDGLTLEGYAAVFNQPTRIANQWEGDFSETIQKGAFARAVRQQPGPVVQFDHGQHPLLGSIPLGALRSMKEDDRGLYVQVQIHDNWLTEPVRDAIKSGAIRGMSFRFSPAEGGEEWNATRTNRTLTDVNVFELGPVVWPAYEGTEVSLRSKQLAEALQEEDLRHDLALALILDNRLSELEAVRSTGEPAAEVTEEESAGPEDPPADVAARSEASAPNPATHLATNIAVRAAQARTRSNLDPTELPDG